MQQSIIRTTAQGTFYYIEQMCLCLIKRCSRAACLNLIMCVFQVTIWVERRTGQVVFTSTLRCPSDQARAASETFSEHISFSTQATSATSTMVGELKRWTHEIPAVLKRSQHQLTVISLRSLCQAGLLTCWVLMCVGDGPRAHLQKLAECIRWSYGAGIVLRLGNIARLELNYCVPMGVQSGDR